MASKYIIANGACTAAAQSEAVAATAISVLILARKHSLTVGIKATYCYICTAGWLVAFLSDQGNYVKRLSSSSDSIEPYSTLSLNYSRNKFP